jgi:hypothetical protein
MVGQQLVKPGKTLRRVIPTTERMVRHRERLGMSRRNKSTASARYPDRGRPHYEGPAGNKVSILLRSTTLQCDLARVAFDGLVATA